MCLSGGIFTKRLELERAKTVEIENRPNQTSCWWYLAFDNILIHELKHHKSLLA